MDEIESAQVQEGSALQPDPPGEQPALVKVVDVNKRFGKALVLDQVNLEVYAGQAVALWGENGAGKTTLLRVILGLLNFEGQVRVNGFDLPRQGKQARRLMGYVPQEAVFYDMSVKDTLLFFARLKKVSPQQIPARLEQLGLQSHQRKAVQALSGGLKQRLALAVALLADPPLLLLDEPTANLDVQARQEYITLLQGLRQQGKTLLFASHRLDEIEMLTERVVLLEGGRKMGELAASELRARLAPRVNLTLWVGEAQRQYALGLLTRQGWQAHLNGRGTLVVQTRTAEKVQVLRLLSEEGILVQDFELSGEGAAWN